MRRAPRARSVSLWIQGRKVIISVGGQNGTISVADSTAANNFRNSIVSLMNTFGFDGVDIDLENGVNPQYMAQALQSIAAAKPGVIIAMAPETIYVQNPASAYLDLALRVKDILTIVNMQYYNTGTMLACDGSVVSQGTLKFLTGLACIQIQAGLRGDQVGLGLPATTQAAGGGYVDPAVVVSALQCMNGTDSACGGWIPPHRAKLRGAMTWSVNWDKVSNWAWVQGVYGRIP
jgi:chitinase